MHKMKFLDMLDVGHFLRTSLRNTSFSSLLSLVSGRRASTRQLPRPLIIFILGAPGVGKGTLSQSIWESEPGMTHLSYGDLVRYHDRIPGSWISSFPRREGTDSPLLPAHGAVKLLRNTIEAGVLQHGQMTWLIDGFPRQKEHVAEWLAQMPPADSTLYLFCPVEISITRIMGRSETSGRPDDADSDKVRLRVQRTVAECEPMLDALEKSGMRVVRVDANRELKTVKAEVLRHVKVSINRCRLNET
ncbi:P-loop containing nucleoside triphosphate hydrolase protein [Annulohypoxylon maeteangense]|uniref:P-loop containing nucleoside triphosphate hydrolase protein n=1 Tax=Annulohypoxylon maeteangense TaxID=1927788 RepID=UPI00200859B0|nr:P-loop containing nucleoside triphosphate hydrolase protein [Annulohypoxylon maeteangense]KAI0886119.1 P-loop containing nucleoside triphosphate hydrolase protein [Annulohypoxylon maeteangense]